MKTERKQIHFLSDVLVAVASLDLKVSNDGDNDGDDCGDDILNEDNVYQIVTVKHSKPTDKK